MRIIRYQTDEGANTYGWILEDKVGEVQGNLFGEYRRREARTPLKGLKLLAPCEPGKIIRLGREVCNARKPLCPKCPVRELCEYNEKTV